MRAEGLGSLLIILDIFLLVGTLGRVTRVATQLSNNDLVPHDLRLLSFAS